MQIDKADVNFQDGLNLTSNTGTGSVSCSVSNKTVTAVIKGLFESGKTYKFRVRGLAPGKNGYSASEWSAEVPGTTKNQLATPSIQSAVDNKNSTITVKINNVGNAEYYRLHYKVNGGAAQSGGNVPVTAGAVTSWVFNANPGDSYSFAVVAVTSNPAFTDSRESAYSQSVTATLDDGKILLSSVTLSTDDPVVGQEIRATVPSGSTATYKWYRVEVKSGKESEISGGENGIYTLTSAEEGHYIKVVATGTGNCKGTVSRSTSNHVPIREVKELKKTKKMVWSTDNPQVKSEITINGLPAGLQATCQWYRIVDNKPVIINDATNKTYTPTKEDRGYKLKLVVTAKASGDYYGSISFKTPNAVVKAQSNKIKLDPITLSTDDPQIGAEITINGLPDGVTATYQWYRYKLGGQAGETSGICPTVTIDGATNANYTPTEDDIGWRIKVVVKGTDMYKGTVHEITKHKVPKVESEVPVSKKISLSLSTNAPTIDKEVTVTVSPGNATVTCQWYRIQNGSPVLIVGATTASYQPTEADKGCKLQVIVTGTGDYNGCSASVTTRGTVSSNNEFQPTVPPITPEPKEEVPIITLSTSKPAVTKKMKATVDYSGASYTCQWFRISKIPTLTSSQTLGESPISEMIENATGLTYTPTNDDIGYHIGFQVTYDFNGVSRTVTKITDEKVAVYNVTLNGKANSDGTITLTASLNYESTTAKYTWYYINEYGGEEKILFSSDRMLYGSRPFTADNKCTTITSDIGHRIKVVVTDSKTGVKIEDTSDTINHQITGVTLSDSAENPLVGIRINAKVSPSSAKDVTYQWYRITSAGETLIKGATGSSYIPTTADAGYRLKLVVTQEKNSYFEKTDLETTTPNIVKIKLETVTLKSVSAKGKGRFATVQGIDFVVMPDDKSVVKVITEKGATVTCQWYYRENTYEKGAFDSLTGFECDADYTKHSNGTIYKLDNTSNTFKIPEMWKNNFDLKYDICVVITGTGNYTGQVYSTWLCPRSMGWPDGGTSSPSQDTWRDVTYGSQRISDKTEPLKTEKFPGAQFSLLAAELPNKSLSEFPVRKNDLSVVPVLRAKDIVLPLLDDDSDDDDETLKLAEMLMRNKYKSGNSLDYYQVFEQLNDDSPAIE